MGNLPLHPMMVHLPLVLAVLLPIVVATILRFEWRGRSTSPAWWIATLVAAVLTAGAFVSVKTGENEEERVEEVVAESAIERHKERAELFLWATLAPLVILMGTSLMRQLSWRRYAGFSALLATLLVAGLAILVGESGGSLVYHHDAGSAYGQTDSRTTEVRHDNDDDD